MDPSNYGRTAQIIGQISDPRQLTQMLRNPQYAGFTNIIVARLTEINRMRQAPAAAAPQPPTVADQAVQGMAKGGIVSFRHGGKVKKFAEGHVVTGGKDISHLSYPYETPENRPSPWSGESYKDSLWNSTIRPGITDSGTPDHTPPAPIDAMAGGDVTPKGVYSPEGGGRPGDIPTAVGSFNPQEAAWLRAHGVKNPPVSEVPKEEPLRSNDYAYPSTDGGIASLSARSKGSAMPDTSLADYYKQLQGLLGSDTGAGEDRATIAGEKKNALNNAMMYAGLGMARAAGEHPLQGILGNMATGATEGLTSYDQQAVARQKQLRELNKSARSESLDAAKLSVLETGQDKRLQASEFGANARFGQSMKPAEREYQMTTLLANELRKKDPSLLPGEAYALARTRINSGMYGAGVRADTALRTEYTKALNDPRRDKNAYFPSYEIFAAQFQGDGDGGPKVIRE